MHETSALVSPELVEAHWPLTNIADLTVLQLTASGDRAVVLVESDEGKFICKTASDWTPRVNLRQRLDAFELLPAKGFAAVPTIVKTRTGELFLEREGRFIYLLTHVKGNRPASTPEAYAKLGALIARLNTVSGYPHQTAFDPDLIAAIDLVQLAESLPFRDEYLEILRSLPSFAGLPRALIHADVSLGNTIEQPDGALFLVDLDDVGTGVRVLDVAFPLIQQFVTEDCVYRRELAVAFYASYAALIQLTEDELLNVFPAALFIALMYVIHGDRDKRWKRIRWAIAHRTMLEGAYM